VRIDRSLVQRLELGSARLSCLQVAALDSIAPRTGAQCEPFDGGAFIAFGPGRFVNRAMGLGLGEASPTATVSALVEFYEARALAPSLEVCPWVDDALLNALGAAGFRTERFRSVYAHDLIDLPPLDADAMIVAESADTAEGRRAVLADDAPVGSAARSVSDEYCDAAALLPNANDLVALVAGQVAACGSLIATDGMAVLGGGATAPAHRRRGLQSALLIHRLHLAVSLDCDLAVATALPAGQSARNLERLGFVQLYTQAVMTRP
jgi:GNAT superfamily N-acetyltransferase